MPFDSVTLELAFLLCSLTMLAAGLPSDLYFHPWHDGPPTYRISRDPAPYGRSFLETRAFSGGNQPSNDPEELRGFARRGSETERPQFLGGFGMYNVGVRNIGNSFSSHVNCEAANQKNHRSGEATTKNIRENIEPIFGSEPSRKADERINFEEVSRNLKTGNDAVNPRIVTPKRGGRPSHDNSAKGEKNPSIPGAGNSISESAGRNQTLKGSKRPRPRPRPPGSDIVFPDGYPKKFVPTGIGDCSKTSTFCEHPGSDYPSEYISQVLKKEGATFREFFGQDVISDPNITERFNAPEENSLCPFRQEVVFPRAAQNKEDKWLFIVNQDQYVQGVTVEVCLNPESRCILTEGFPLGYTPYCKQKYIERRLVAIGEDGKPHSDSFRLPSCCSCVVKHETSARMGFRSLREATLPPKE